MIYSTKKEAKAHEPHETHHWQHRRLDHADA
jgi:hypothetical protein